MEELGGGQGHNDLTDPLTSAVPYSPPWPLILLEVDIYVGIVHGSMGEKAGR